ncbi:MAG: 30S ribosomal protein S10 [Patescibacteria group bacterium]
MTSSPVHSKKHEEKEADKPRIRIKLRAYDHKIIDQAATSIIDAVLRSGAQVHGPIPLPTDKSMVTVLKSTFVYKDARDQYEMRTHKRLIDIIEPTAKTTEMLTTLTLPAGVGLDLKTL